MTHLDELIKKKIEEIEINKQLGNLKAGTQRNILDVELAMLLQQKEKEDAPIGETPQKSTISLKKLALIAGAVILLG